MKHLILVAVLFVAGCATPTQQWLVEAKALSGAEQTIESLHEDGIVSDELLVKLADNAVKPARAALDTAEQYLPEGGPTFEVALKAAKAAIEQINTGGP